MNKKQLNQIDFKSLERSHNYLYPQICSKLILNLLASRFGPNRFDTFCLRSDDGQTDCNRFQFNLKVSCEQGEDYITISMILYD